MSRRYLAPVKAILVTLGLVAAFLLVPAPSFASAHSCGDVWCDGNDGSTRYNSNGNDPQIYIGEVGTYLNDWNGPVHPCPSGVGGMCFLSGAADGAVTRYQNSTGISVHFYYFLGGPDSGRRPSGVTAYCWGWKQANAMFTDVGADFGKWDGWASVIFGDIEGGSTYGWDTTTQTANRDVLDGFRDNVANNSSQQPGNATAGVTPRSRPVSTPHPVNGTAPWLAPAISQTYSNGPPSSAAPAPTPATLPVRALTMRTGSASITITSHGSTTRDQIVTSPNLASICRTSATPWGSDLVGAVHAMSRCGLDLLALCVISDNSEEPM